MQKHVHIRPYVQMAELQRPLQRDGERREGRAVLVQRCDRVRLCGPGIWLGVVFGRVVGWAEGCCWHATGHWDVGVHVEFEEVVERVGDGGDGAGDCFRDAVVEG